jgi:hypothetical protein
MRETRLQLLLMQRAERVRNLIDCKHGFDIRTPARLLQK